MRQPWFRRSDGWWYITIVDDAGRRHERLAQSKDRAFVLWHDRESTPCPESPNTTALAICEAFLQWSQTNSPANTFKWHELYLMSFCRKWGGVEVSQLRPWHMTKWLAGARFKTGTRKLTGGAMRAGITSVKRAFSWATEEGYLESSPFSRVRRPGSGRRTALIDGDLPRQIAAATDGPFRLFLLALRHSGARPKEVRVVESANVDLANEVWTEVLNKTKKQTGLDRTIYISSPCLHTVTRILMHFRPHGPLFRNSRGEPWTDNAVRCRMRRLRGDQPDNRPRKTKRSFERAKLELPRGAVAYSFRHTYITEALEKGIDAATVAALTGTSIEMIQRHYGHLTQKGDHLRCAARRAGSLPES